MFDTRLFYLVSRLMLSRWARGRQAHYGPYEEGESARLGPLHLEVNHCLVLDHADAAIGLRVPTPWGSLHFGYVVCLGQDVIRRPGFHLVRQPRMFRHRPPPAPADEPLPF